MKTGSLLLSLLLLAACGNGQSGRQPGPETSPDGSATAQPGRPEPATFLVFADVTRSLTAEEQASVIENVKRVIEIIPPRSRLMVFPILEDVPRTASLFSGELSDAQTTNEQIGLDRERDRWKTLIPQKLDAIFHGSPVGRDRTCISGALQKADEIVAGTRTNVEIILISDMLEDCDDSILGGKVQLQKRSIADDIVRARALPGEALLHLNAANVTAILPTVPTSKSGAPTPSVASLKDFWRAVLDRCGDSSRGFRFGTEMPQRLLDLKPQTDGAL